VNLENRISGVRYIFLGIAGFLALLLLWSLLSYTGIVASIFLPTPTSVLSAMGALFATGNLLGDIFASLERILLSFLLSLAVAVPLGITLGLSKRFEAFSEPLIAFVRYIPPSAFIPLAIIWFGIGEWEKIVILFLGIAPYLALLTADIVINTRRELVEVALTLGASRRQVIARVVLPNAMPGIWDSFRVMIGIAWTYVIIAEIVGASSGLGYLMTVSQRFLRTDDIFAGMVVIGILGFATDYFFKLTYKIFFPWTEKSSHD
jgi:NitT/TauT family transport system permease protein